METILSPLKTEKVNLLNKLRIISNKNFTVLFYYLVPYFCSFSALNRVKKRQHKLEGVELKITVMEAAYQRGPQLKGQKVDGTKSHSSILQLIR